MRQYSAKVLMFGEYVIIQGSSALALPFKSFVGSFENKNPQYNLSDFYVYLNTLKFEGLRFKVEAVEKDEADGIHYVSNIPVGYGLGSSGALCAAVFDRYFEKHEAFELDMLKQLFSKMESFFHGSSSGLDPLVSYLNSPMIIDETKQIELLDPKESKFQFFLVDTGKSRVTSEYVKIYLEKMKQADYQKEMKELVRLNQMSIQAYQQNDDELMNLFFNISQLQADCFAEMIPPFIKPIYDKYKLKLCGAGGGGFFLGICPKEEFDELNSSGSFIALL